MSRLIDADTLFKEVTEGRYTTGNIFKDMELQQFIKEQPTAFDTEQVIHNLECEKTIWFGKKITTTDVMKIEDAIDIVKKGGVE